MPRPPVPSRWIDGMAFGTRVLRGGENPWRRPEELGLFHRELAALLSQTVIDMDAEAALDAFCETAAISIGEKDAGGVEKLLVRSDFAAFVSRGIDVVMGAAGSRPMALSLPGPGKIARRFLAEDAVDEDVLDDLSMALTGLLRSVFKSGIGFIRLTEIDARALEFLSPLTNVARHYECTALLVLRGDAASADEPQDFDFVYREKNPAACEGAVLPMDWWRGNEAGPTDALLYAEIPADSVPEFALARLAELTAKAA